MLSFVFVAWAWVSAHFGQIVASGTTLTIVLRLMPPSWWQWLEKHAPRFVEFARFVRAMWPDAIKGLRTLIAIWRGGSPPGPSVPLLSIAVVLGLAVAITAPSFGCRWQRPDPQCPGRAREQRCRNGIPSECDTAGYWMPLQDRCSDRALECRDRVPGAREGEYFSACVRPDSTRGGVQETPEPDAGASDGGAP